jgi:DnaJ-class molecular chaperone
MICQECQGVGFSVALNFRELSYSRVPCEKCKGSGTENNEAAIEKGFCDKSSCNNWPECNYQKDQNPPCVGEKNAL